MQYGSLVSDALSKTARLIPLALVPLVASLARWPDVLAVATEPGVSFGVKFGLPHPLADLWTFIDAPSPEGADSTSTPRSSTPRSHGRAECSPTRRRSGPSS